MQISFLFFNPIQRMVDSNCTLGEEDLPLYFSEWLKSHRQALDLTQAELAKRASCSVFTLRKIEAGERRPSKQLAELLARAMGIPLEDQATFVKIARGGMGTERLARLLPGSYPAARSSSVQEYLPRALTPFIGREPELAALGQLLRNPQCSLLTIVGPGGIGKTRLAIEAARQSKDLFPDGTWFVPLAALNSPLLLLQAIADALNFKFQDPTNHQAQLVRYLRSKQVLLVLDNVEHLLEGVELFAELLKDCQQVKFLVTSRERMNLLSEWVFEVQGLPVPPDSQAEQFEGYSSVAVFLQSARRVQADFTIREPERSWVLKICRIMEGMPLGIELSAVWVSLLSCEEIAKEIEHNLDFLSNSMRDLPERHRSLRATLDHSWKLLNAEEKLILSRLSVFHGSFRRDAAHGICGASLEVLSSLKNKNLLYRTGQDYFSLHEIIRQYAVLKLKEDPGEEERVKDKHSSYYVHCLSDWEKALKSSQHVETFNDMAQVIDDLSQAWQRMVTNIQPQTLKNKQFHPDLFHKSLFSLSLFYEMRCRSLEAIAVFTESCEYLKTIRGACEQSEDGTCICSVLGQVTAYLGLHHLYVLQYKQAREYLEESVRLLENSPSRGWKAQAQVMFAADIYTHGKLQESIDLLEQCRHIFQEEGDVWWYLASTVNLARYYLASGKILKSEALSQECLRLLIPGDLRLELPLRIGLAMAKFAQKDFVRAEEMMQDTLQLSYHYGNQRQIAYVNYYLGQIALATNRITLAKKYFLKAIDLLSEYQEFIDLGTILIDLGKCLVAQQDRKGARDQFQHVIEVGQAHDKPYLVHYGLVCIASILKEEGETERALEIVLALRECLIEHEKIRAEVASLLAGLQIELPPWQVEAATKQLDGMMSPDQAVAHALALAVEHETG